VAVGVAEVGSATAALAAVDLTGLPAGGVGVVGDAGVLDAAEGGAEFCLAEQESVMVLVDAIGVV
jgi:hypothetical protein